MTPRHQNAFTLIELLTVIGIIAILISIVIAVIPAIRKASQVTSSRALINALQAAVDQYQSDHQAYPGPLTDDQILTGVGLPGGLTNVTMSENMTLGLLGGLRGNGSGGLMYSSQQLGKGAINLSPITPGVPHPYLNADAKKGNLSSGGAAFKDSSGRASSDSVIPEFIDAFAEPLPILYLRAIPAAPGIMSDATTPSSGKRYQYDLRQILGYTSSSIGAPTSSISHGLRTLGNSTGIPLTVDSSAPNEALRYFRQPGVIAVSPNSNATGTPRQKDRYILISAGRDRIYGTADDITNFGSLTD